MESGKFSVSVIIPVFNGEVFLSEAVRSIQQQQFSPLEIIIVDDGSTDGTANVVESLKGNVRYIHQTNNGPSVARNKGISIARGNIIGFIDVDDLWSVNKLKLQLDHFVRTPSEHIVVGYTQRMQRIDTGNGTFTFTKWAEPLLTMHIGSALFRRSVFDTVGLFDESLDFCEDWDWFMRAKELHVPIMVHRDVTYFYRRHGQNMTNDTEVNFKFALRMLKKSLDRRRARHDGQAAELPKLSDFTIDTIFSRDTIEERKENNTPGD